MNGDSVEKHLELLIWLPNIYKPDVIKEQSALTFLISVNNRDVLTERRLVV